MEESNSKPLTLEEKREKWLKDDFTEVVAGLAPLESGALMPKRPSVNPNMYRPDTSFKAGVSGNPTGRRRGAEVRKTVRQIVEDMQFNPIEAAVMIIREDKRIKKKFKIVDPVPVRDKLTMVKWLGDKIYPSLKAVEVTNIDGDLAEAGKPKTVQLYLPEKGSPSMDTRKKQKQPVELERDISDTVRVELTPQLANSLVIAGDGEVSEGKPQVFIPTMGDTDESNTPE